MKTNGCYYIGIALFWLFALSSANSQIIKEKAPPGHQQIFSRVEKYPSELINSHIRQIQTTRNAFKSSSPSFDFTIDSIAYYSLSKPAKLEIFSYYPEGNLQSILTQIRDNGKWLNSEKKSFSYDEDGNLLTELLQTWAGFYWENNHFLTYTYDMSGNMLTFLIQNWESGHWGNYELTSYEYYENSMVYTSMVQLWNSEKWLNSTFTTDYYDDRGFLVQSIQQHWTEEKWVYASQNVNTYNFAGLILSSVFQSWNDYGWNNILLTTLTYDEYGNNLTLRVQFWGGIWLNYSLITRTFDENGNKLSELSQEWSDTWNNITNSFFTYDENNNCTSQSWFGWTGEAWESVEQSEYEYVEGLIIGIGHTWDGSEWLYGDAMLDMQFYNGEEQQPICQWYGSKVEVYYTALYTELPENNNSGLFALSAYPNPATDILHLDYNLEIAVPVTIYTIDLSGKTMNALSYGKMNPGFQSTTINTGDLVPGNYLIKMTAGGKTMVRKVTINR